MANPIKDFALSLVSHGFSVVPVNSIKKPMVSSWKEFQLRLPTPEEINAWPDDVWGVAVVCGPISKCLVYDVDQKQVPEAERKHAAELVIKNLQERIPEILSKLYIELSMNGGIHFIARCKALENYPRNEKLQKWAPEDEEFWTETRGEGGYCIVAPSPGYRVKKISLLDLPDLSIDEFAAFMDVIQQISNDIPLAKKNDEKKKQERERDPARKIKAVKISDEIEGKYGWRA
jgi:hypothetical protein